MEKNNYKKSPGLSATPFFKGGLSNEIPMNCQTARFNNESRQPRSQAREVSRNSSVARIGATLLSPRERGVIFQHWIPAFPPLLLKSFGWAGAGMTIALLFSILYSPISASAETMSSNNYKIESDSLNFGGGRSTSASYTMEDTAGEVGTGISQASAANVMSAGYQQTKKIIPTPTPTVTATPVLIQPGGGSGTSGGGPGGGGTAVQGNLTISDLNIIAGADQAVLTFKTNSPAQTKVEWGTSEDLETGLLQNASFNTDHKILITGLATSTKYFVLITVTDAAGYSTSTETTLTTVSPVSENQLPNPTNFTVKTVNDALNLSWNNPTDTRFSEVVVLRSELFFPMDETDGSLMYQGPAESFIDESAVAGRDYYYTIFAKTFDGAYSSGALAKGRIYFPGQTVGPTDPFANIPQAANVDPMIQRLTLADFEFWQEGKPLMADGNSIDINGTKDLTIRLKYEKVPEILKTVAFTLQDPADATKTFSFLLRVNSDKSYYTATIGALGRSGQYSMSVVILDYQNQGLKRLNGTLTASAWLAWISQFTGQNFGWKGWSILGLLLILILIVILFSRRMAKRSGRNKIRITRIEPVGGAASVGAPSPVIPVNLLEKQ